MEIAPPPSGATITSAPVTQTPPPPPPRLTISSSPAAAAPAPPPPVATTAPVVRLSRGGTAAAAANLEDVKDTRFCPKHPLERVTAKCVVCGKGICPKCMVLFGYVCSPLCKEKAELQGIAVPKFAGQRDAVESQRWRKVGLVAGSIGVVILLILGVWFWYAWFGSHPRPVVTLRFEDESAMSGMSAFCEGGQMVFIHGDKLARYDIKQKKQVWLRHLLDKKKIGEEAAAGVKSLQEAAAQSEFTFKIPSVDEATRELIRDHERAQQLRVFGRNLWVADGHKARRFDWDTGEPKQEIEFSGDFSEGVLRGDTLEFRAPVSAKRLSLTRFNLANGKVDADEIGEKEPATPTVNLAAMLAAAGSKKSNKLNPQQLGAAVANAPLAGKLAAPATISVARRQQEALNEMDADESAGGNVTANALAAAEDADLARDHSELIPLENGFAQITVQMTEQNIVTRSAVKAAPKKSALEGPVNAAASMEIANELLNEMSRNSGGDIVRENHSKYHVKIHLGGGKEVADWEGDVVGAPEFYPQKSVNVLVAGTTLLVFDLQNQKKWSSTLMFPIAGGGSFLDFDEAERNGLGPVVERGDTLYVFDQGVLSAFDLASGNARWRLPSVGITGMYFDESGMIYLNTTTASPDKIKYSRQIDVTSSPNDIVLKLDPKNGKEIWKHSMGGRIAYLSGKYIYTLSYTPPRDDGDEFDENLAALGLESKPYVRIRRISPKNGRVLWDHYQPRGALDVQIHDNAFQLVLKKEVQVLQFISF
ncbi:MAG: PQQ-binding-like beta-propeller repeat protein [Verrucomicrobiota bacterium]